MEVVVLDQEARKAFREKTASVYKKWVPTVGAELVEKAEKAIAASQK